MSIAQEGECAASNPELTVNGRDKFQLPSPAGMKAAVNTPQSGRFGGRRFPVRVFGVVHGQCKPRNKRPTRNQIPCRFLSAVAMVLIGELELIILRRRPVRMTSLRRPAVRATSGRVWRSRCGWEGRAVFGQRRGVNGIGFGAPALDAREATDTSGFDNAHGEGRRLQDTDDGLFMTAGGFTNGPRDEAAKKAGQRQGRRGRMWGSFGLILAGYALR